MADNKTDIRKERFTKTEINQLHLDSAVYLQNMSGHIG
jgi:hypothetical protein